VNVTLAPTQIFVVLGETVTEGVTGTETIIVTAFEVALAGDAQFAFDVITTVTTSPLFNEVEVNDGELVPTFVVFTFHW
jgi:hypothetical protein